MGWKEYELELLRDNIGNVIIICSIENFDPMGIHTGDSITVAPAMTLPDTVYQHMRDLAIKMMNGIGQFAGGCNVQFALNPDDDNDIIGIEINPRVSSSSALASKATGYPIAKIAAKLAIGYHLDELKNAITGTTTAYFEPAIDYVIVKVPRWNFDKFHGTDRKLGLQMKSVGEAMGIGRNFQEALQKACQSLEIRRNGLGADGKELTKQDELLYSLEHPSWNRVFHIYDAIKLGIPLKTISKLTKIDRWFLKQIEELVSSKKRSAIRTAHDQAPCFERQKKKDMLTDKLHTCWIAMKVKFIKSGKTWASIVFTNWWIPVLQSLKQRLLTTTQHLIQKTNRILFKKENRCAGIRTESHRAGN